MEASHYYTDDRIHLGMGVIGLAASSILYGITLSQTYAYCLRFPCDPLYMKTMVAAIVLLETISVVFVTHASWHYLVDEASSELSVWSLNAELAVSMVISGITETFLSYRVWMISGRHRHRRLLTFSLMFLALLHFVSGEFSAVQFFQLKEFASFDAAKVPSILRLASAAICDTSIAISLCYFLHQKRTGYKKTDKIIDWLIIFAIKSGILTSLSSVAALLTYLLVPTTWVYLALSFSISRLYANTFLCSLNTRQILRQSTMESNIHDTPMIPRFRTPHLHLHHPDLHLPNLHVHDLLHHKKPERAPSHIDVYVITETVTQYDSSTSKNAHQGDEPAAGMHMVIEGEGDIENKLNEVTAKCETVQEERTSVESSCDLTMTCKEEPRQ